MDFSQIPLKPMQQPDAISGWPLAPGWWLLLALSLLVAFALWRYWKKRSADPRRFALQALKQIEIQHAQASDDRAALMACNALLKRSALSLFPRQDVAALAGERWLAFLLAQSRGCEPQQLALLVDGPYRATIELEGSALFAACRQWIKTAGKGKQKDV